LTGRAPFRADTAIETLRQVRENEPQHPRSLNTIADPDLATIALKCLEKYPGQRYGSAEALADDLQRWLDGHPIQARPPHALERLVKWAYRRPAQAALLLVGLVAALGVGGAIWGLRSTARMSGEVQTLTLGKKAETKRRQLVETKLDKTEAERQREAALRAAEGERHEREVYPKNILAAQRRWEEGDIDE